MGRGGDCEHEVEKRKGRLYGNEKFNEKRPGRKKVQAPEMVKREKVCVKCGAVRKDGQIGLEGSPKEYVEELVKTFREVKRILKEEGTLWVVIGDCYAGSTKGGAEDKEKQEGAMQASNKGMTGKKRVREVMWGGIKEEGHGRDTVDVSVCVKGRRLVFEAGSRIEH